MELKGPAQKIQSALYINSIGFLKNPAEYFSKLLYEDCNYFYDQVKTHRNLNHISTIISCLKKPDLLAFIRYLPLIVPLKYDSKKTKLEFIKDDEWEQFLIDYKSYFLLYKIDKRVNKKLFLNIKQKLESTYSTSWQTSLNRIIKWPTTDAPLGLEQFFPKGWQESGLLSSSGYIVGKSGATEASRRLILSKLVEQDIKAAIFKASYIKSWGEKNSLNRLLKIARTIAALCRNAKGSANDFEKAISEWESDLAFLKDKYFEKFLNLSGEKWPRT